MRQIKMIFVGRLAKEKGFDLILDFLIACKDTPFAEKIHCHIFGSGELQEEFEKILPEMPFVTFHGFQPKEAIDYIRQQADITLMPSTFLETFGLSALESLQLGVPVVGFAKGGIAPFLFPEYQLDETQSFTQQMMTLLQKIGAHELPDRREDALAIAKQYTQEMWLTYFKKLLGKERWRILLVSDYICLQWGVEQYLHNVYHLLTDHGFEVELAGVVQPPSRSKKWLYFLWSLGNGIFAWHLYHKKQQFQPDLIWRHGVQRVVGRLPLALVPRAPQERVMYHETGLFHPFPAQVSNEEQLARAGTLGGYLEQASPWLAPFVFVKALLGRCILSLLGRRCQHHLVPSAFLIPYGRRWLPDAHWSVFHHFSK
jgi:hypothetical protein